MCAAPPVPCPVGAAQAVARTAAHRLRRGIWTSSGAGDIRRVRHIPEYSRIFPYKYFRMFQNVPEHSRTFSVTAPLPLSPRSELQRAPASRAGQRIFPNSPPPPPTALVALLSMHPPVQPPSGCGGARTGAQPGRCLWGWAASPDPGLPTRSIGDAVTAVLASPACGLRDRLRVERSLAG